MNRFFRIHEDMLLAGIGVFLGLVIVFYAVWSVMLISKELGSAVNPADPSAGKVEFDLVQAKKVNFRGLQ